MASGLLSSQVALAEDSVEGKFLNNVRQVTDGFVKAGEGYFSPDAKEIVYQAVPKDYPFYQIYRQSLDAGTPHRVSTGARPDDVAPTFDRTARS